MHDLWQVCGLTECVWVAELREIGTTGAVLVFTAAL